VESLGPPRDARGTPLNLTALKQGLEAFIWQQGWPEQAAARGVRARAEFRNLSSELDDFPTARHAMTKAAGRIGAKASIRSI
jgi:hypothetical protein